jgi:type IV pilus assembly protein PilF
MYSDITQDTGNTMRKILSLAVLVLALCVPPALAANPRNEAKAQVKFGIEVAQKGLWKSAQYHWEKAVEIDPTYAAAFNNLAVAYEHEGLFEKARKAYDTAISLDPKNASIRQNYEFFKEINDRASRRNTR